MASHDHDDGHDITKSRELVDTEAQPIQSSESLPSIVDHTPHDVSNNHCNSNSNGSDHDATATDEPAAVSDEADDSVIPSTSAAAVSSIEATPPPPSDTPSVVVSASVAATTAAVAAPAPDNNDTSSVVADSSASSSDVSLSSIGTVALTPSSSLVPLETLIDTSITPSHAATSSSSSATNGSSDESLPSSDDYRWDDPEEKKRMSTLAHQIKDAGDGSSLLVKLIPWLRRVFAVLADDSKHVREMLEVKDSNFVYFLKAVIPAVVRFILVMEPVPPPVHPIVDFIKCVLRLIIECLPYDIPELYTALSHIFGATIYERPDSTNHTGGMQSPNQRAQPRSPPSLYNVMGQARTRFGSSPVEYYWVEEESSAPVVGRNQRNGAAPSKDTINEAKDTVAAKKEELPSSYADLGKEVQRSAAAAASSLPSYSGRNRRAQGSSYWLISFINYFGHNGGFTAMMQRLQSKESAASLATINRILTTLVEIRLIIDVEFLITLVPILQERVCQYFLTMNDDATKTLTKLITSKPLGALESLISITHSVNDGKRVLEQFDLDLAIKYLALPLLNKRIQGINDIKDYIDWTQKKEDYQAKNRGALSYLSSVVGGGNGEAPVYTKIWMSSDHLVTWLLDVKLVDELLHPDTTHIELIRRSYEPLRLFLKKGCLTDRHLEMLWSLSCRGRHESEEHLIYDIIRRLSDHLPLSQLKFVFKRISDRPFYEWDLQLLAMVKDFTLNAYRRAAEAQEVNEHWYGLNLCWAIIQARQGLADADASYTNTTTTTAIATAAVTTTPSVTPSTPVTSNDNASSSSSAANTGSTSVSVPITGHRLGESKVGRVEDRFPHPDVTAAAMTTFLQLLGTEYAMSQRGRYMNNCVALLQKNRNVPQSLSLLTRILKTYPRSSKGWFKSSTITLHVIIEKLDTSFQLLDHVLQDLELYKTKITSFVEAKEDAKERIDPNSVRVDTATAHLEQIQIRQNFLVFILTNSSLTLTKSQIDRLWVALVIRATSDEERDSCFTWMIDACDSDADFTAISEDLKKYLFLEKIIKLAPDTLTPIGFKLVQHYMARVNERANFIRFDSEYGSLPASKTDVVVANIVVQQYDALHGLDLLWGITITNNDDAVGRQATQLLNVLHQNLSSRIKAQHAIIRDGYLKKCLDYLARALLVSPPDSTSRLIVSRSVSLLKSFLHGFRQRPSKKKKIIIKIVPSKEFRVEPFDVTLTGNDTIARLRQEVFDRLVISNMGISLASTEMVWDLKKLVSNHTQLRMFGIQSGDEVSVRRPQSVLVLTMDPDEPVAQAIPTEYSRPSLHVSPSVASASSDTGIDASTRHSLAEPSLEKIASDPKSFERLFDLLSPGSVIGEDVWDILMLLPTNRVFLRTFTSFDQDMTTERWNKLFDSRSLYRLLYALQIIDDIMQRREQAVDQSSAARQRWAESFIVKGGLAHLIRLLLDGQLRAYNQSLHGPRAIYHMTVALLLRIINNLLCLDPSFAGFNGEVSDIKSIKGSSFVKNFEANTRDVVTRCIIPLISQLDTNSDAATDVIIAAMRLLVGCCRTYPSLIITITEYAGLDALLVTLLLRNTTADARTHAARALFEIAKVRSSAGSHASFWLGRYFALLQSSELRQYASSSEQLFYLLVQFVDELPSISNINSSVITAANGLRAIILDICTFMLSFISTLRSCETYDDPQTSDAMLVGSLSLLRALVRGRIIQSADITLPLLTFVYTRCLLDIPNEANPLGSLCKSIQSRPAAYALLHELALQSVDCYTELLSMVLRDNMWTKKRITWNYDPSHMEKRPMKFVGLKNQGATCYMNSFMQQLYMVPSFREGLLSIGDYTAKPSDDSILHQMQVMFGYLKISQKKFFDTIPFCRAIREPGGQAINLGEQRDCNEFAGQLFEQLEVELKSTNNVSLLDDSFRGGLMHQFISKDCGHVSEREEPFYMLSVTVKNKTTLQQAFEAYITADLLDGENKYACAKCKTKVTAEKRTCIYSLPDHLIVHLKRFEFDFDAMRKVKVNDKFEFATSFSIFDYTREGLAKRDSEAKAGNNGNTSDVAEASKTDDKSAAINNDTKVDTSSTSAPSTSTTSLSSVTTSSDEKDEATIRRERLLAEWNAAQRQHVGYYDYTLAGILVHTGMADAGHYYSYIKDASGEWFEFNDTAVRPFDTRDIAANCFGGSVWADVVDVKTGKTVRRERQLINNAYMLIYDRVYKRQAPPTFDAPDSKQSSSGVTASVNDTTASLSAPRSLPVINDANDTTSVIASDTKSGAAHAASSSSPAAPPVSSSSSVSHERKQVSAMSLYDRNRVDDIANFPPAILQAIWNENMDFLSDKNIFDFNYLAFLWNLTHINHSRVIERIAGDVRGSDMIQVGKLAGVQIVTNFVFKILVRSLDNESFPQWLQFLKDMMEGDAECRRWLLDKVVDDDEWTDSLLFHSPTAGVSEAFVDLLLFVVAVHRLDRRERELYGRVDDTSPWIPAISSSSSSTLATTTSTDISGTSSESSVSFAPTTATAPSSSSSSSQPTGASSVVTPSKKEVPSKRGKEAEEEVKRAPFARFPRSRSAIIRMLASLLKRLPVIKHEYRSYHDYWRLLREMAMMGHEERTWMIHHHVITHIVSFYVDTEPLKNFNHRPGWDSTPARRINPPGCKAMAQLLAALSCSCTTDSIPHISGTSQSPSQVSSSPIKIHARDRDMLLHNVSSIPGTTPSAPASAIGILPCMLRERDLTRSVIKIINHWCWHNGAMSQNFIDIAIKGLTSEITSNGGDLYRTYFRVLSSLLQLRDTFHASRVDTIIGEIAAITKKVMVRRGPADERYLVFATKYLMTWSHQLPLVADRLISLSSEGKASYAHWFEAYKKVRPEAQ